MVSIKHQNVAKDSVLRGATRHTPSVRLRVVGALSTGRPRVTGVPAANETIPSLANAAIPAEGRRHEPARSEVGTSRAGTAR